MRYDFTIQTDHFQFYLEDQDSQTDTSMLWVEQAISDHLAVAPDLIGVGTARYGGPTRIVIEIEQSRPTESFDAWDRVAECSINIHSGQMIIHAPEADPSDAESISLPAGAYGAMVYYGNLVRYRTIPAWKVKTTIV